MQAESKEPLQRKRLSAPQRREAILAAALPRFAARGFDATSVADVAAAARVTKPVLYDHFHSKQALYTALLEREETSMFVALAESFDPEAPLEERFRALALSAIGFARRHPDSSQLLFRSSPGDDEARAAHERSRARTRTAIAAAIAADPVFEASPGLSRKASAELLGDLHAALLERLIHWALAHPDTSAKALGEVFVDVLWSGLDS